MFKKACGYLAITAGVITVCYAFASPWLVLKNLTQAFEDKDTNKIEKLINFSELRDDIKATSKAVIMKSAVIEMENNLFSALGMIMANAIVDPIIDQMISPAGLQLLFSTGEMSIGSDDIIKNIDDEAKNLMPPMHERTAYKGILAKSNIKVHANYVGINDFEVIFSNTDLFNDQITFIMKREGIGNWRVNGIEIPISIVERLIEK